MATLGSSPATGMHKQKKAAPRIDMTPMVDLAFLLLTFFVMTSTLMKQSAMEMQQPLPDTEGLHKDVKPENVLNLVIGKNDQVYWYMGMPGNQPVLTNFSASGIRTLLNRKKQEVKNLYVFIKASDESRYKNTIDVLDEIVIAGIANYAMLELDEEDQELID